MYYGQVVENHCHKIGAKLDDISLEVEFQQDEITLDFPEGQVKEGWEITPRSRPVVSTLACVHIYKTPKVVCCILNLYRLLRGK